MSDQNQEIQKLLSDAKRIIIIQADNPDADSLGSALALEQIIHDMGKEPVMYCGIDMPDYLKYMDGWDRVNKEIPSQFDLSIIVDTSAHSLLQLLEATPARAWIASRPCVVLDHHAGVTCDIPYATIVINDSHKVSTGDVIFELAKVLKWPLNKRAQEFIMNSILSDSLGLTTENTTAETYRTMAELVEGGVDRPKLEEKRRAYNRMPEIIFRYKADLIKRTEVVLDGLLAITDIPQAEISQYSPHYNPAPLIQPDHLQTESVLVSIVLKHYDNGRVTAAIRCNQGAPFAAKLAEHFGGGGHAYAAGFKVEKSDITKVKNECIEVVKSLFNEQRK